MVCETGGVGEASPQLSICQGVLRLGALAEDLGAATAAGFTVMQVEARSVEATGIDKAARMLADTGMRVSCLGGTAVDPLGRGHPDAVRRSIDMAAALGTSVVGIHPGPLGDLTHEDAADRTRAWFSELGPTAAASGVTLALEPIHPLLRHFTWVHTLRQAATLVAGVDGAGLLVDIGHLWWDPDLAHDFRRYVDRICLVQLTNVDREALVEERYQRAPLAAGGDVAVTELVRGFHDAGYRGFYEHEVRLRMPREERRAFAASERVWFDAQFGELGEG